ncbi:hypothetical protein Nmel_001812 [Mimus melanotis]
MAPWSLFQEGAEFNGTDKGTLVPVGPHDRERTQMHLLLSHRKCFGNRDLFCDAEGDAKVMGVHVSPEHCVLVSEQLQVIL